MIKELIEIARELNSKSEEELNTMLEETKETAKLEEKAFGKVSLVTNLKSHMLIAKLFM